MVHFAEMAQFVDYQVIGKFGRKLVNFIAEIQVLVAGTASPSRRRILDKNFSVFEVVMSIKKF